MSTRGAGMPQQLPVLGRRELVVERNEHTAGEEDRVGRDQPLRLIRHDDRGAIARREAGILQRTSQRMRPLLKFPIRQPFFLALAIRFDQASLRSQTDPAHPSAPRRWIDILRDRALQAGLDARGQGAEVAYALDFVVG